MKQLSAVLSAIAMSGDVEHFMLVAIGDLAYGTTLPYDVTVGGVTYSADHGIVAVDPPRLSKTVDRETYKIKLADPEMALKPSLDDGIVGKPVSVYVGVFNTGSLAVTAQNGVEYTPGQPILSLGDMILAYRGRVNSQEYVIDVGGEVPMLTVECAGPMADLDMSRPFYTSRESQRSWDSTDNAFDAIYEGSTETLLKWGKS